MYSDLGRDGNVAWIKEASRIKLINGKDDGKPISFSRVVHTEEEPISKEYPFKAILGSSRYHLGSGTRTNFSDRVRDFELKGEVEISFDDINGLNIKEDDEVKISSPYGSIRRIVKADKGLKKGLIFIPAPYNDNDVMNLIRFAGLGIADSPGWKSCDVKIEKA
jgi:anaerobic selenocysteine-containing dehydrogenase